MQIVAMEVDDADGGELLAVPIAAEDAEDVLRHGEQFFLGRIFDCERFRGNRIQVVGFQSTDQHGVEKEAWPQVFPGVLRLLLHGVGAVDDDAVVGDGQGEVLTVAGHVEDGDAEVLAEDAEVCRLADEDVSFDAGIVGGDAVLALGGMELHLGGEGVDGGPTVVEPADQLLRSDGLDGCGRLGTGSLRVVGSREKPR